MSSDDRSRRLRYGLPLFIALLVLIAVLLMVMRQPTQRDAPVSVSVDDTHLHRIVVLPLANSGGPKDDYLALGITDDIRSRLNSLSALRVVAPVSADSYPERTADPATAAEELTVEYVLSGTVRSDESTDGGRLYIQAQLFSRSSGKEVWNRAYDRALTDIGLVATECASDLAEFLDVDIAPLEQRLLERPVTADAQAYQYYLKAQDALGRSRPELAGEMLGRAIMRDTAFAQAYASLAVLQSSQAFMQRSAGSGPVYESLQNAARASAERVLRLRPELPEAFWAMGYYYQWAAQDEVGALEWYQKGLEQWPRHNALMDAAGQLSFRSGEFELARALLRTSIDLDPLNVRRSYDYAHVCLMLRRFEEALDHLDRALRLQPQASALYGIKLAVAKYGLGSENLVRQVEQDAIAKNVVMYPDPITQTSYWDPLTRDFDAHLAAIRAQRFSSGAGWSERGWYFLALADGGWLRGDTALMTTYADSACSHFETHIEVARPSGTPAEQTGVALPLSMAYALNGRRDESTALLEGVLALAPQAPDRVTSLWLLMYCPRIWMALGEAERALDLIEDLLSRPSPMNPAYLEASPYYDAVQSHPRFRQLVEPRSSS